MSAPAVELRAVDYSYPDGHRALTDVDLTVAPGERVAVLGPNGAGKTTLVLTLNGVLTPSDGDVRIGGLSVEKQHLREVRRRVGIVFLDPDDQLSCRPSARTSASARPTSGYAETISTRASPRRWRWWGWTA